MRQVWRMAEQSLIQSHLDKLRHFYDERCLEPDKPGRAYRGLLARYYRYLIPASASVLEVGCGTGELLAQLPNKDITGVDLSPKQVEAAARRLPHGRFIVQAAEYLEMDRTFDVIILSDTLNESADVQAIFANLHKFARPDTRLIINFFNNTWRPILGLLTALKLKSVRPPSNWLSHRDIENLLHLSGWEIINREPRILFPAAIPLLEPLFNRYIAPLPFIRNLCLSIFCLARPIDKEQAYREKSVTVVIPARNESGNLLDAVTRTPQMGAHTEIIFIEGNSTDDTWAALQKIPAQFPHLDIKLMQQSGKGKGNAVREAFAAASGEVLMILDADLTMPPEELPKYYKALVSGKAEFVNGVRLVYPMEDEAMQFANMCANHAFSLIFSYLLGQPVRDTLCGTKVLFKSDYERIVANRAYFGNFDPFGDFDLLFGAAKLNLKIADIPIRYRNRTYGTTNISRWKHGVLLLRMVLFASGKMKFI
ncbi:MAG: glycosyltransferase [Verrucomicrobiota bacterium]|nr:glycosyltransferase [Verrucomicrobiota bacterium]